jgi:uncharacterized protein
VAPAQFRVPPHPKVVRLALPLMRADAAAVGRAAERWRPRLQNLPRPLTAVLVGGATKPYRLDAGFAAELLRALEAIRARDGGTLYLTTSRRTQPEVTAALEAGLPAGALLHRWTAKPGEDNPYAGLLGLADRFVVTGDSISMMIEVASLGRPLAIAALPMAPGLRLRAMSLLERLGGLLGPLQHLGHRLGITGYARDLTTIHSALYRKGMAVALGQPFPPPGPGLADELRPVVERMRALVA